MTVYREMEVQLYLIVTSVLEWDDFLRYMFLTVLWSPEHIQGEHKVFPWLQTPIKRKLLYVEYKHIFF